jgi:hypothetical protein
MCVCVKKNLSRAKKASYDSSRDTSIGAGAEALVCCGSREEDEKVAVGEEWNCLEKRE